VKITRIDETKNDLILSEREAWVSFSYGICGALALLLLAKIFSLYFLFSFLNFFTFLKGTAIFVHNFAGNVIP
jgi:hypothetical protein